MTLPEYRVLSVPRSSGLQEQWNVAVWQSVPALHVAAFRPESTSHRPRTEAKLLRSPTALHGFFRVHDNYVRSVHTGFQQSVYQDSCVEFFVQPKENGGYFNFEFNCGGAMLAFYIVDHTRTEQGFADFRHLTHEQCRKITIHHSLPEQVEPEICSNITWFVAFRIPITLLEEFTGPLGDVTGRTWRANFYKCGDATSHPHWAAWSPVDELNFHLPRCFGRLLF